MVKKKNRQFRKKRRFPSRPTLVGDKIYALLEAMGGSRERGMLARLWSSWPDIVGEDVAQLATPCGHRDKLLLLEAEDAMDIQEIQMQSVEIIAKVNQWLKSEYFDKLKVGLKGF